MNEFFTDDTTLVENFNLINSTYPIHEGFDRSITEVIKSSNYITNILVKFILGPIQLKNPGRLCINLAHYIIRNINITFDNKFTVKYDSQSLELYRLLKLGNTNYFSMMGELNNYTTNIPQVTVFLSLPLFDFDDKRYIIRKNTEIKIELNIRKIDELIISNHNKIELSDLITEPKLETQIITTEICDE